MTKTNLKIGILGTRGIPNYHGGFEQFAEFFAIFLVENKHDVYVYSSSDHPFKKNSYNGVNIIHCYDPEHKIGTFGQFIYDLNCIKDSRKRNFDLILQLGYTSNSIWGGILPKKAIIVTNMDGLEWKRSKYSSPVRKFLKYAEKLAVKTSDYLIADSLGVQDYLKKTYNLNSEYIAYGATVFDKPDKSILKKFNLDENEYNMLIARIEPENNIETILDGVVAANNKQPFLVIGKYNNEFGRYLHKKFQKFSNILFLGGIYNIDHLNNLRYFSNIYFHGHSVGGTNPSLLEAMASNTLIVAHDNMFNKSILNDNAFYFQNVSEVKQHMEILKKLEHNVKTKQCIQTIEENYKWDNINKKYLDFFNECYIKK